MLYTKKIEVVKASIFVFKRKVRDSNPRYNAMCTPHFECGSFDHSDNFPCFRLQRYCFFLI